jgi:hypothetical protein
VLVICCPIHGKAKAWARLGDRVNTNDTMLHNRRVARFAANRGGGPRSHLPLWPMAILPFHDAFDWRPFCGSRFCRSEQGQRLRTENEQTGSDDRARDHEAGLQATPARGRGLHPLAGSEDRGHTDLRFRRVDREKRNQHPGRPVRWPARLRGPARTLPGDDHAPGRRTQRTPGRRSARRSSTSCGPLPEAIFTWRPTTSS